MSILARASLTITDLYDPIQQEAEPENPVEGMLWLDTSASPTALKRWNGFEWDPVSDTSDIRMYLRMDSGTNYVEIGHESSEMVVRILSDRVNISPRAGGPPVAYFSAGKMLVRNAEVDNTLRFGNYYVMPASDGGVKFVRA